MLKSYAYKLFKNDKTIVIASDSMAMTFFFRLHVTTTSFFNLR